ncbi:MAG: hypothetical protein RR938_06520, partial [Muribaculaceae bacterium]
LHGEAYCHEVGTHKQISVSICGICGKNELLSHWYLIEGCWWSGTSSTFLRLRAKCGGSHRLTQMFEFGIGGLCE